MNRGGPPTHIGEIEAIRNIYELAVQKMAKKLLLPNCFAREGDEIRPEILPIVKMAFKAVKDREVTADDVCFQCSISNTEYYEDCHGGQVSFKFH